jgi:hypothetical protein
MLSRRTCLIIAFVFVAAFAVSLTFDWHGAFAVAFAIDFFFFVAGSTRSESRRRKIIAIILMAFSVFSAIANPHQNLVFVSTVVVGGAVLFFNPVGRIFARSADSKKNV